MPDPNPNAPDSTPHQQTCKNTYNCTGNVTGYESSAALFYQMANTLVAIPGCEPQPALPCTLAEALKKSGGIGGFIFIDVMGVFLIAGGIYLCGLSKESDYYVCCSWNSGGNSGGSQTDRRPAPGDENVAHHCSRRCCPAWLAGSGTGGGTRQEEESQYMAM